MATHGSSASTRSSIVDTCFTVEQGDVVTIITDDEHAHLAKVVAEVAAERGGWPVIMNNETPGRARPRGHAASRWRRPRTSIDAMLAADEIIIMTNLEWANRFAHVNAVRESCANNVKIASVEGGMGDWDITVEDILARHRPRRGRDAQARGRQDLPRLDPRGHRRARLHRGAPTAPGHAHQAARLDDGSPPALGRGRLRRRSRTAPTASSWSTASCSASAWTWSAPSPSTWTVKDGKVVKIEGERDAEELDAVIEGVPNVDIVASSPSAPAPSRPSARPPRRAASATSTSRWATTTTPIPGGQNVCRLHLDGVVPQRHAGDRGRRAATSSGTASGTCERSSRRSSARDDVAPDPAARRQLEPDAADRRPRAGHRQLAGLLHASRPARRPARCAHATEELAYVLSGTGELRLEAEAVVSGAGDGPAHPGRCLARGGQHRRRTRDRWCSRSRIPTTRRRSGRGGRPPRSTPPASPGRRAGPPRERGRRRPAACSRMEGYTDLTLGHVSARVPGRGRHPGSSARAWRSTRCEPEDVIDARPRRAPDGRRRHATYHLESVLHTEVYRARAGRQRGHPRPPALRHRAGRHRGAARRC